MNTNKQFDMAGETLDGLLVSTPGSLVKPNDWTNAGGPGETEPPKKNDPEIEPEKMPNEDPGIQPNTKPKKEDDDDDDDDDDDYTPYTEPEIGDDPDKEKIKVPIM